MSPHSQWPAPAWLADLPDIEREKARTRYLLRIAGTYAGERGGITALARCIDTPVKTIHSAIERGQVSPEMAIAIESALGRRLFPRELFRPDLFTIPAEARA